MLKQQIIKKEQLDNEIFIEMRGIFDKVMSAGIITPWGYKAPVTSNDHGFSYTDYEVDTKGLELHGTKYSGCGDYDHVYFSIPLDQIDNVDAYIQSEQDKLKTAQQEKLIAAQEKAAKETEEQTARDREQYEKLKQKFEGGKDGN